MKISLIIPLAGCLVLGCGGKNETIIQCVHGINPVTKLCNPPPADGGQAASADAGSNTGGGAQGCPNGVDPFSGACNPEVADAGSVAEDVVAGEEPTPDISQDGQCSPLKDPMNLKIGNPCTDHCQCSTGYCYDEAYLAPFRFCTKDCSSGAGSGCPYGAGDFPEYACLKFTVALIKDYELVHAGLCMPRCQSAAECAIYAPNFNVCPESGTKWDDYTVQVVNTCQIQ